MQLNTSFVMSGVPCTQVAKSGMDDPPSSDHGSKETHPKQPIQHPLPTGASPRTALASSSKQSKSIMGRRSMLEFKYFFRRCLTGASRNPIPPLHCLEFDAHKYQILTRTTHPQHATVARNSARNAPFRPPCPLVPVQGPPKHSKQSKASKA